MQVRDFACVVGIFAVIEFGRFVFRGAKDFGEQIRLAPYYAVDGLRGCASDGAYGEGLGRGFWRAVVAFGFAL